MAQTRLDSRLPHVSSVSQMFLQGPSSICISDFHHSDKVLLHAVASLHSAVRVFFLFTILSNYDIWVGWLLLLYPHPHPALRLKALQPTLNSLGLDWIDQRLWWIVGIQPIMAVPKVLPLVSFKVFLFPRRRKNQYVFTKIFAHDAAQALVSVVKTQCA